MRRVFTFSASVILVIAIILNFSVTGFAAWIGDVNNDGKHSLIDAKLVLESVAGLTELSPAEQRLADVSGDGKVTILDAKYILQIIAYIKEPPVSAVYPELEEKLEEAENIDQDYYTEDTVAVLNEAIQAGLAVSLLPDADEEQIKSAIADIDSAINSLKSYRQCLEEVVAIAESLDTLGCEPFAVRQFENTLSSARILLADDEATPVSLKAYTVRLEKHISNIELYKQELDEVRQNLSACIENKAEIDLTRRIEGSAYTAQSVSSFEKALTAAQEICENPASTKTDVEQALKDLETAESLLRTYKQLLRNHIKSAQKLYQEEYLVGSPDLKTEINRVALIYNDPSSTDEDYIKAMNELSAAVKEFSDYYNKHTDNGVIYW